MKKEFDAQVLTESLRKALNSEKEEITDENQGISIEKEKTNNSWAEISDINEEWGEPNSEYVSARNISRLHSGSLLTSPLYFRGAAIWFKNINEDDFMKILFEGEMLSEYLTGVKHQYSLISNPIDKWKTELLYYISHFLKDKVN